MKTLRYALFGANPLDNDFLEKIKYPPPNLDEEFGRDSIDLSSGVLVLFGYSPGQWLNWVSDDATIALKFKNEWITFDCAREAIRGNALKGFLDGSIYYVKLIDLFLWFLKRKIQVYPGVISFVQSKCTPTKRGRPQDLPEIIQAVANYFKNKATNNITPADLKSNAPPLQELVKAYLSSCNQSQIQRRLKTLSRNVNRKLTNQ